TTPHPPNCTRAPAPAAAPTRASLDVPLTAPPAASRTSWSWRTRPLTSVTVTIAFTRAAGSGLASTTTIVLMVPCVHGVTGARPAATRLLRPTVATAKVGMPAPSSLPIVACSVPPPVRRPPHRSGTPWAGTYPPSIDAGSVQGSPRATCRFTMARAVTSPPPHTAEESVVSGHAEVRTTASGPINIASPSIMGQTSIGGPEADEEVGAKSRKAAYLRVRLVEDVLGAGDEVEPVHPAELLEEAVGAARVPARVPTIVDV